MPSTKKLTPSHMGLGTCAPLSTLYYKPISQDDKRLQRALGLAEVKRLTQRLEGRRESLSTDRSQIYHLDGFTGILIPVATPLSAPAAKLAFCRLRRYEGGPQVILLEIHGAVGPSLTLSPQCLNSVTLSSASGSNHITLRPEGVLAEGRGFVQVLEIDIGDRDEDDGFWGAVGDFFGGIADAIGDFFGSLWEWLKKFAKEIWEQIKNRTAKLFLVDKDKDGVPDGAQVEKEFKF